MLDQKGARLQPALPFKAV